jgi:WD40 repeat protein
MLIRSNCSIVGFQSISIITINFQLYVLSSSNSSDDPSLLFIVDDSVPISIDWIMQDTSQFVVTYESLKTIIYDTETGKVAMQLVNDDSTTDASYRINRILSHPSQPILITAHDDRKIRYFDKNSGKN